MAFSGKNARVRIGLATFLCGVKWTVNMRADELDTTCFENVGFGSVIAGVHEAEVTLEGIWENSIHANPPDIMPGNSLIVELFIDWQNLAGVKYFFPDLLVLSVNVDTEVRGLIKYTLSGKTRGTWSAAGGIAPPASEQN